MLDSWWEEEENMYDEQSAASVLPFLQNEAMVLDFYAHVCKLEGISFQEVKEDLKGITRNGLLLLRPLGEYRATGCTSKKGQHRVSMRPFIKRSLDGEEDSPCPMDWMYAVRVLKKYEERLGLESGSLLQPCCNIPCQDLMRRSKMTTALDYYVFLVGREPLPGIFADTTSRSLNHPEDFDWFDLSSVPRESHWTCTKIDFYQMNEKDNDDQGNASSGSASGSASSSLENITFSFTLSKLSCAPYDNLLPPSGWFGTCLPIQSVNQIVTACPFVRDSTATYQRNAAEIAGISGNGRWLTYKAGLPLQQLEDEVDFDFLKEILEKPGSWSDPDLREGREDYDNEVRIHHAKWGGAFSIYPVYTSPENMDCCSFFFKPYSFRTMVDCWKSIESQGRVEPVQDEGIPVHSIVHAIWYNDYKMSWLECMKEGCRRMMIMEKEQAMRQDNWVESGHYQLALIFELVLPYLDDIVEEDFEFQSQCPLSFIKGRMVSPFMNMFSPRHHFVPFVPLHGSDCKSCLPDYALQVVPQCCTDCRDLAAIRKKAMLKMNDMSKKKSVNTKRYCTPKELLNRRSVWENKKNNNPTTDNNETPGVTVSSSSTSGEAETGYVDDDDDRPINLKRKWEDLMEAAEEEEENNRSDSSLHCDEKGSLEDIANQEHDKESNQQQHNMSEDDDHVYYLNSDLFTQPRKKKRQQ